MSQPADPETPTADQVFGWERLFLVMVAGLGYAAVIGLFLLHCGLVLFEDGDFGEAPVGVGAILAQCLAITVGCGVGFPWMIRHHPTMRGRDHKSALERHTLVAIVLATAMLGLMMVISPAGGRRVGLSIAIPIVALPLIWASAWRGFKLKR